MNNAVAVVVPYFNGSSTLDRALESIALQTSQVQEIIVIDDGSSDSESAFARELCSRTGALFVRQENAGQSAARNFAFKMASSDLICFLDQDDRFLPNHVERLLDGWQNPEPSLAMVYASAIRTNESGQVVNRKIRESIDLNEAHIFDLVAQDILITPSQIMISKSSLIEVGGFDSNLRGYEDDDLIIRLFLAGKTFRHTNEASLAWTINRSSTSYSEAMVVSALAFSKKMIGVVRSASLMPSDSDEFVLIVPRFLPIFLSDLIASCKTSRDRCFRAKLRLIEFLEDIEIWRAPTLKWKTLVYLLRVLVILPRNMIVGIALLVKMFGIRKR